jgi:hypothetical protein
MDVLVDITNFFYYKFIGNDRLILLVITSCAHKNAHDSNNPLFSLSCLTFIQELKQFNLTQSTINCEVRHQPS